MQPDLLTDIEKFLTTHGMHPTTFGRGALRDPTFVFALRKGRDIRSSTAKKVRAYMEGYSPSK